MRKSIGILLQSKECASSGGCWWQEWSRVKSEGVSTYVICIWRIQSLLPFAQATRQKPAWREDRIESIMGITSFFYTFCSSVRWDNLFSILATFSSFGICTVPQYQRKDFENKFEGGSWDEEKGFVGNIKIEFQEIICTRILLAQDILFNQFIFMGDVCGFLDVQQIVNLPIF